MSAAEIKEVDAERLKDTLDNILSRSIKNPDGSIDVVGNVDLCNLNLKKLPFKFNKVIGGLFFCCGNELTSIKGSPNRVYGTFDCSYNQLTSLNGCPIFVRGDFWCGHNNFHHLLTQEQVRSICNVKGDILFIDWIKI